MSLFEPKTHKNQGIKASEYGGALIWILIMVALFAALSYAINQGSRGGASDITTQQAKLAATEILDYAHQIKNAVRQLQINGCRDIEISFDQAFILGYSNPNSPSDNSCHVFHPNGGAIRYQISHDALDSSHAGSDEYGSWVFPNDVQILNIGDQPNAELLVTLPYIAQEICLIINENIGVDNPSGAAPADDGFNYTAIKFVGSYADNETIADDGGASELLNKTLACYLDDDGFYNFYQVLIAR